MLDNISPYALLCQSKPRPPRHVETDYDRFSIAQGRTPEHSLVHDAPLPAEHAIDPQPSPAKRTHYIADIHARHSSAMRHAPQNMPHL